MNDATTVGDAHEAAKKDSKEVVARVRAFPIYSRSVESQLRECAENCFHEKSQGYRDMVVSAAIAMWVSG